MRVIRPREPCVSVCGPAGSNKTQAAYAFARAISAKAIRARIAKATSFRRVVTSCVKPHPRRITLPEGRAGLRGRSDTRRYGRYAASPHPGEAQGVHHRPRRSFWGPPPQTRFSKTLEPPSDVVLILARPYARKRAPPPIVSRCQVVPFRHIPASEAAGILVQNTGCTLPEASIAIEACGGSHTKAADFFVPRERARLRLTMTQALATLARADDLDVLGCAAEIVLASKAPLDQVRRGTGARLG